MRFSFLITVLGILAITAARCPAMETKEARLARLQTMSAAEKEKLRRNQERLATLPETEQEEVRDLEKKLANDPQGDQLRHVMLRYHEWLRALPSAERAALLSLVEEERVLKIKSMLAEQETERLRELAKESLTQEDAKLVREWLFDLMNRRKLELLEQLPQHLRPKAGESNDPRRLFEFVYYLRENDRTRPPPIMEALKVTDEDRQRLVEELSSKARDVDRQASSEEAKKTVFQNWFFVAFGPRPPSPEELREFLQRLPAEERDRLENLPPDQMKSELMRKIFFDRKQRWEKDRRGPFPGGLKGRPLDKPKQE